MRRQRYYARTRSSRTFYSQTTASNGSTCAAVGQSRTCYNGGSAVVPINMSHVRKLRHHLLRTRLHLIRRLPCRHLETLRGAVRVRGMSVRDHALRERYIAALALRWRLLDRLGSLTE